MARGYTEPGRHGCELLRHRDWMITASEKGRATAPPQRRFEWGPSIVWDDWSIVRGRATEGVKANHPFTGRGQREDYIVTERHHLKKPVLANTPHQMLDEHRRL